jgi:phosphoglycerate dehydrogenase-like enzyme
MGVAVVGAVAFRNEPEVVAPLRDGGHEVRVNVLGPEAPAAKVVETLREADVVLAGSEFYTPPVMDQLPRLKLIARIGVGYDAVDLPAATERGILVTTTQGANDWAVADHAFALMLALCHNITIGDRHCRAGRWVRSPGVDLWQKTLGVVGLGRIGRGLVLRGEGFRMKILATEPFPDVEFVRAHNVELVSLDELMRRSDFVSLHLPNSAETRHIVDEERLSLMKPSAYLVNTARGPLIDEDALERALESGNLAGAGLDVREVEPPEDNRFAKFDNVVLSAHVAGVTREAVYAMSVMACQGAADVLAGKQPEGLLNPEAWETRRRGQ